MGKESTNVIPCMWNAKKVCTNCIWEYINRRDLSDFLKDRSLVGVLQSYAGIDKPTVGDLSVILLGLGRKTSFHYSSATERYMVTPHEVKNYIWKTVGLPRRIFIEKNDPNYETCYRRIMFRLHDSKKNK